MLSGRSKKILTLIIGNGFNILANLLTMPFLVRSLSYDDYGTFGQTQIVISLLQLFFLFSLNQSINLLLVKNHKIKDNLFTAIVFSITSCFLGSILILLFSGQIAILLSNVRLEKLLILAIPQLIFQSLFSFLFTAAIFLNQVKKVTFITVISNVLRLLFIYIAIKEYHTIDAVINAINIVSGLQVLLVYLVLPQDLRGIGKLDYKVFKEIFKISGVMLFTSIVERSTVYIDGLIISALLTTTQYAIYRAGAFEVPFLSAIYGSVSTILIPEVTKLIRNGDYDNAVQLKRKAITSSAFLLYPALVFLLFFSKPLMEIYLSSKYSGSAIIFSVFSLSLLVRVNDYQDILIAKKQPKIIFKTSLIMLFINLILNYYLIKHYGILGGAIAYMVWLFAYATTLSFKTSHVIDKKITDFFDFKKLLGILLIACTICLPIYVYYTYYNGIISLIGCSLVYFPLIYLILYKLEFVNNSLISSLVGKFK